MKLIQECHDTLWARHPRCLKNICSNKKGVLLAEYAERYHAVHQDVPHLPTGQSRESRSLGTLGTFTCANKALGKCL